MNIKSVIIDDEPNNIDNLSLLLKSYCPEVEVIATARNAEEGKTIIRNHKPGLIFLDIQMPGMSGFDMLGELHDLDLEIIFVTAYHQYAINAMKFSAVDYLLKPINLNELQSAVGRAGKRLELKQHNIRLENLIGLLQKQQYKNEHRIGLTTLKETRFVKTDEIVRCESSNNYTTFFLVSREQIVVSRPIYEYEDLLADYGFIRCHQSHLINRTHVKSWIKETGGYILMADNEQIPLSRNKKEILKKFLHV
ncbi:MAG: response regulator transcription factor [Sphingobacteriaceae bacterium]|nr:MAG: response regulator transcription factor [Sphingobacteriaceae bacterium]